MHEIDVKSLIISPFTTIGDEWMLISAGTPDHYNTMTASWGGLGVLWGTPTATIHIRPQRYTRQFIEKEELFTLSFFHSSYRQALSFCGSHSGREFDKAKETGLIPIPCNDSVTFKQAKLVLVCRKKYRQEMTDDAFLDRDLLDKWYPKHDLHTTYIGEIIAAYENEI